jgi:hypothetical protein
MAEADLLKGSKCRFESDRGYSSLRVAQSVVTGVVPLPGRMTIWAPTS